MLAHHQGRICSAMRCRHLPKRGPCHERAMLPRAMNWQNGFGTCWTWKHIFDCLDLYESFEPHFAYEISVWRLSQFQTAAQTNHDRPKCEMCWKLIGALSIMTDKVSSKVSNNFCFRANSNGRTSEMQLSEMRPQLETVANKTATPNITKPAQHFPHSIRLQSHLIFLEPNWGNSPRNPMVIFQPRIATCCQQDTSGLQGSMLTGVVQGTATVPWNNPPLGRTRDWENSDDEAVKSMVKPRFPLSLKCALNQTHLKVLLKPHMSKYETQRLTSQFFGRTKCGSNSKKFRWDQHFYHDLFPAVRCFWFWNQIVQCKSTLLKSCQRHPSAAFHLQCLAQQYFFANAASSDEGKTFILW